MLKRNRNRIVVGILVWCLIGLMVASAVIATYADRTAHELAFMNLEIDRYNVLNKGSIYVPIRTQTPGIFEPTLTAIAVLNTWRPVVKEFDGIPLVEVPAGCFYMGSTLYVSTQPITYQCFDTPFWIGQTEVTHAQYKAFMESGGYSNQDYWTENGWKWLNEKTKSEDRTQPIYWTNKKYDVPDKPVIGVGWYEAMAYTKWLTQHYRTSGLIEKDVEIRLPTEAEWEYAARGPNSLLYPWGNDWVTANAVFNNRQMHGPSPVGSIPAGASWVGALDMSSNVWEQLHTLSRNNYVDYLAPYSASDGREDPSAFAPLIVIRGGAWYFDQYETQTVYHNTISSLQRGDAFGFRVVLSAPLSAS